MFHNSRNRYGNDQNHKIIHQVRSEYLEQPVRISFFRGVATNYFVTAPFSVFLIITADKESMIRRLFV